MAAHPSRNPATEEVLAEHETLSDGALAEHLARAGEAARASTSS